jgi:hypothetical protein
VNSLDPIGNVSTKEGYKATGGHGGSFTKRREGRLHGLPKRG